MTIDPALAAEVASACEILEGIKKFTEEDEATAKADLERLCVALCVSGLKISEAEQLQIVTAVGCPRGH